MTPNNNALRRFLALALLCASASAAPTNAPAGLPDLLHLRADSQINFSTDNNPQHFQFSADGKQLLSQDNSGVGLWDIPSRRLLWRWSLPVGREWQSVPERMYWQGSEIIIESIPVDSRRVVIPNIIFRTHLNAQTGKMTGQEKQKIDLDVKNQWLYKIIIPNLKLGQFTDDGYSIRALKKDPLNQSGIITGNAPLAIYTYDDKTKLLAYQKLLPRPDRYTDPIPSLPIVVYSQKTKKVLYQLSAIVSDGGALDFSPNGHYLSQKSGNSATIWDLQTGQKILRLRPQNFGEFFSVTQLTWGSDSKNIIMSDEHGIQVFEIPTGKLLRDQRNNKPIQAFSTQGTFASNNGNNIYIQQANSDKFTLGLSPEDIYFSPSDRSFMNITRDDGIWLYHNKQKDPIELNIDLKDSIQNAELDAKANILKLYTYSRDSDNNTTYSAIQASLNSLDKSKTDKSIQNLAFQRLRYISKECPKSTNENNDINTTLSNTYAFLLCQGKKNLSIYSTNPAMTKALWQQNINEDTQAVFSKDDQILLIGYPNNVIHFYNAQSGALINRLTLPAKQEFAIDSFQLSPNRRLLALRGQGGWRFFDTRTAKELPALTALKQAQELAFVDGGNALAAQYSSAVVFYPLK